MKIFGYEIRKLRKTIEITILVTAFPQQEEYFLLNHFEIGAWKYSFPDCPIAFGKGIELVLRKEGRIFKLISKKTERS